MYVTVYIQRLFALHLAGQTWRLIALLLRKFGKHIQKRQLDIPEYAASFVDYKALKKLIKRLSATPIIHPQAPGAHLDEPLDSKASLQANKATFFFRLERELEKVNTFYLQKEAELKLRLRTLSDRKRTLQQRGPSASKLSSVYRTLDEGFRLFNSDLDKLQQFVEVNQTAFSKILKKWDKTSKSRTKELYLSRAVEVQPCFNRDVISDLSDQATTSLLELAAWAEGENLEYHSTSADQTPHIQAADQDENDVDSQIQTAFTANNISLVSDWINRISASQHGRVRVSRLFLQTINQAPVPAQKALLETSTVDINFADDINERTALHELAISGRLDSLTLALDHGADVRSTDVYGRIPIHYACMRGHVAVIEALIVADRSQTAARQQGGMQEGKGEDTSTVDYWDLDNFTPLVHGIVHSHIEVVKILLSLGARIDPASETDHIPLNLACQHGSASIVDLLLQSHPKILPDAEGLYPQHLVPRSGRSPRILLMLKNYGADLDQPDKLYQWTPLFHAASEGHLQCAQTLLQSGVNADVLDEKGFPAMYYAAWEGHLDCLKLLEAATQQKALSRTSPAVAAVQAPPSIAAATPLMSKGEPESIPDLSLPPPIIPLRRYGHNFLDTTKTYIVISFDTTNSNAIEFYGDNKYPAARLTISSKSSDLIPRNVALPIQDEFKNISFQIENLDTFSIDFDIYPTFGSRVIARAAASSRVFTNRSSSSGSWHLELFDPRLRAIGRMTFRYQVVTPFRGVPLEVSQFATYWKATSQISAQPSALITGSSLSGNYIRIFVQMTRDGIPVLFPRWAVSSNLSQFGIVNDLIPRLTFEQLNAVTAAARQPPVSQLIAQAVSTYPQDPRPLAHALATSCASLKEVVNLLSPEVHLDIHVIYPSRTQEDTLHLGPTSNMNTVVDSILAVVFEHASQMRQTNDGLVRGVVFSSYNPDVCIGLNWKQPNYPVLLCNDLGVEAPTNKGSENGIYSEGRAAMSVKEAVKVAQGNNFMGLVCSARLLALVPALSEAIKVAGLVLITDVTGGSARPKAPASSFHGIPDAVDGMLEGNAVLRFKESLDV
ncbi:Glycerophosphodiester phosphodiesterase GDE1 [Elsinoe australis]|uniref:Glycerophosphodiester phosphodiesterase GDE1 n=1 Tax=Elsinoe australis TaxID=40998 RepID=A0A2P7YEM9_9PEZI|nr:Glycerophosphodiester phosphodiesterase GDE1 [Elsinoe australis]